MIRGGQVFDSIGGTASIADVAMEDGRIVDVGTALDGDDAIDATGHAVYPGFIGSTCPITIQSNSMRIAASDCLTVGADFVRPSCSM